MGFLKKLKDTYGTVDMIDNEMLGKEADDLEETHSPQSFFQAFSFIEDNILKPLRDLYGSAYIAGGCPRDIYMDRPFSDIDIFIPVLDEELASTRDVTGFALLGADRNISRLEDFLKQEIIFEDVSIVTGRELPSSYRIESLVSVASLRCNDFKFQIILLKVPNNPLSILDTFAINISKCYFDEDSIIVTNEARLDMLDKKLTHKESNRLSNKYRSKIMSKFPDYTLVEEADNTGLTLLT